MTNDEMFEKCLERPDNFHDLLPADQWYIDSDLGILDLDATKLSEEQLDRYMKRFGLVV